MTINRAELQAFLGLSLYDVAAAHSAIAVALGDRLGLYRALADGPATSQQLAARTNTDERYVREWLLNQAAGGYVTGDGGTYSLSAAQREVLVSGDSVDVAAAMELALAVARSIDALEDAFRGGSGLDFAAYDARTFVALDRFSAAPYRKHLVRDWLPSDVTARLDKGARVVDLGCGAGTALLLLAERFPRSTFIGIDNHPPSIDEARTRATPNARFDLGDATAVVGQYDLVMTFDLLHDAADPAVLAKRVASTLVPGGAWLLVEPRLFDSDDELLNPYGRFLTALSLAHCIPVSRAAGGPGHGMTMRRGALLDVVRAAGFAMREVDSPAAMVIDARLA